MYKKATDFLVTGFFHQAIKNLGSVRDIVDFEVLKTIEWIVSPYFVSKLKRYRRLMSESNMMSFITNLQSYNQKLFIMIELLPPCLRKIRRLSSPREARSRAHEINPVW
jgi:hypothetical protein